MFPVYPPVTLPDDYVAWVASLSRFKRFSATPIKGGWATFTFDSKVHMAGHQPGLTHYSTFTLQPEAVVRSVNWRRLAAYHIRSIRFAVRRQTHPRWVWNKRPPAHPNPP
ncbi:MAG: hypothetical protein V4451_06010 [Pseudomonadota bacterium]